MRSKILQRMIAIFIVFLMSINSFAALVSDNDGSAFITKAEFDSLKNNFQSQIDQYNQSIDSKIDGAIAAYLAGISTSVTKLCENYYGNYLSPGSETPGEIAWTSNDNYCVCNESDQLPILNFSYFSIWGNGNDYTQEGTYNFTAGNGAAIEMTPYTKVKLTRLTFKEVNGVKMIDGAVKYNPYFNFIYAIPHVTYDYPYVTSNNWAENRSLLGTQRDFIINACPSWTFNKNNGFATLIANWVTDKTEPTESLTFCLNPYSIQNDYIVKSSRTQVHVTEQPSGYSNMFKTGYNWYTWTNKDIIQNGSIRYSTYKFPDPLSMKSGSFYNGCIAINDFESITEQNIQVEQFKQICDKNDAIKYGLCISKVQDAGDLTVSFALDNDAYVRCFLADNPDITYGGAREGATTKEWLVDANKYTVGSDNHLTVHKNDANETYLWVVCYPVGPNQTAKLKINSIYQLVSS